jgi:mannitol 2-dehydrogenase
LEDDFSDGRPALERVGVQLVDDVAPYERMKLRILNGSHQALAYLGLLAGHEYVHEAVGDPAIRQLVEAYITKEATPTIGDVPGIDLDAYRGDVFRRFANHSIADTLVRIATDGAERLKKFVLPVLADLESTQHPAPLAAFILAAFAAVWASPQIRSSIADPAEDRLLRAVRRIHHNPAAFLDDRQLFGRLDRWDVFRQDFSRALVEIDAFGLRAAMTRAIDRPTAGAAS